MSTKTRSEALKRRDSSEGKALRPSILVIDDDASVRDALHFVLKDRYDVTLCASAEEGLAALTDDVYVVILDVKLKGKDGFWTCAEIQKRQADVPIIFYSAYQKLKDPYDIINEHRPFGYIVKGGELSTLLDRIEMAVQLRRIVMENRRLIAQLGGSMPLKKV